MKRSYKYIAFAFAIILCSCNKEVMFDITETQVEISANIIPCVLTRVTDDGTSFSANDQIKVQNVNRTTNNIATYTYSSKGNWNTSDKLYWGVQSENTFKACYPATAEYDLFTIPADQTTGNATADWMTATTTASRKTDPVQLSFNHNLTKITVTIESWNNEYTENERVASLLELHSLSSVMTNGTTLSGDNQPQWVKANVKEENKSFVAIVAPGKYSSASNIMQVYVNGSTTPLMVKTTSELTLEAGKAYSFKLTVGKNLATISSTVTVGDWGNVDLDNQDAAQQ